MTLIYLIISGIVCWILPLSLGIVGWMYSSRNIYSDFCWLNNGYAILGYFMIRGIDLSIFYIGAVTILSRLKVLKGKIIKSVIEKHTNIIKYYMKINIFMVIVFVAYSILDFANAIKPGLVPNIWFLICGPFHCLCFPALVIGFNFNKEKIHHLINALLCRKDSGDSNEHSKLIQQEVSLPDIEERLSEA